MWDIYLENISATKKLYAKGRFQVGGDLGLNLAYKFNEVAKVYIVPSF